MSVLDIIAHLGLLLHIENDLSVIVQNLVQKKESFPSMDEFHKVVGDAVDFLNSGILKLPDDVKAKMIAALQLLEAQLWPVAPVPTP